MGSQVWQGKQKFKWLEVLSSGTFKTAANVTPTTSDGAALGTTALKWSDLFLASGAVINFDSGDVTITHSSNLLTIAGGGLTMGASGTPAGDLILWGTTALYYVSFDVDGDTNGAWYFGANDYGIDVRFPGQTASNEMLWDASANALVFTAGGITMGTASILILPVKAVGAPAGSNGELWLDTTDYYLHFYGNSIEYKLSTCAVA